MNNDTRTNSKAIGRIFLAAFFLAAVPQLGAAEVTKEWSGGTGIWNSAGNWIPSGTPNASDTVGFGGESNYTVNLGNVQPTVTGMVFSNTELVNFVTSTQPSRNLSIGSGGIIVNEGAGTVLFSGTRNVFPRLIEDQEWRNDGTGNLTVGDAINLPAGEPRTLTLTGTGNFVVVERMGADWGPLESLVMSGEGTLTANDIFTNAGSTVESGTLLVNGAHAKQITVNQAGTLGGTGTIGSTRVAGNLEPGSNGIGLLTIEELELEGTAVTTFEIAGLARGDGYDALDVIGDLILGGAVNVVFRDGFHPTTTHTFNLFDAGGELGGDFTDLNLPELRGGGSWDTSALSTAGELSVIPGLVEPPVLTIQRADDDNVRLSWPSDSPGWTLQSSADLDSEFADAEIDVEVEGDENVAYDTTTDPRKFYRLILADGPIAVFVEDFEDGMGDWTTGGQPDQWEIGVPTTGPGSAFSGSQVAATRLNGNYETGGMDDTVSWLRSPVIDLTGFAGAGLSFREFLALDDDSDDDGNPFHFATISVLDADSMEELGEPTSYNELISEWTEREIDLSAFAGRAIVLEFGLATDEIEEFVQAGWYLDDITVTGIFIQ